MSIHLAITQFCFPQKKKKKNDGKFALGLKLMHKDPLQKKRKSEEMKFIRRKVDARDLHTT